MSAFYSIVLQPSCVCFYELAKTVNSLGLEAGALWRSFPFADCTCCVSLAGRLELRLGQVWATESPGGEPCRGCLGRAAGAVAGAGSGHRGPWGQAMLEPGAIAEASRVCRESRGQAGKPLLAWCLGSTGKALAG